jgi:oligopeptide/dipeptide ABC transporter ATP-binding protein
MTEVPTISLERVDLTYRSGPSWARIVVPAIRSVSLQIAPGETLGVVGESGSGKTSLAALCLGLVRPSAGVIRYRGNTLTRRTFREARGEVQVVFQDAEWSLNPRLRIERSLAEPLVIAHVRDRASRQSRISELLEVVGLDGSLAGRYPHQLSGGQQQRVAIARALATRPRFVVFDEVVSALDVSVQTQVANLIRRLQHEYGFASLFISHDLAVVRYVAQRIAVMYAGEIVEVAPAAAFYERASHPYTRALQDAVEPRPPAVTLEDTLAVNRVGCPLSPRCPFAIDRCHDEKPVLREIRRGLVACHRAEEVATSYGR